MARDWSKLGCLILAGLLLSACGVRHPPGASGAYRLDDGRLVSLRASHGHALRARFYASGESLRLVPDGRLRYVSGAGFSSESPVEIVVELHTNGSGIVDGLSWSRRDNPPVRGQRVNRQEELTFSSGGKRLSGRLDLPDGPGPHPAVVLVHGSGNHAATDYYFNGDFLARHGIATLTYDKRGSGDSAGKFTFDFQRLAGDVVAAVEHLATRPDIDAERIGLSAYSQGAWVAPLAADSSDRIAFVIVHYGLVASPAEEARVETRNVLRQRGVDEDSLEQVDELTRAAVAVVASDFREGWDELAEVKRRSRHASWRKQLDDTVIGKFVSYPRWLIRLIGPRRSPAGMPWYYDSGEVLERLSIPMVWLLAEEDSSAPLELALPALRRLQQRGKPYEITVFPGADHTMLLFDEQAGQRVYSGYAPGYFRAEVEAARRLAGLD